MLTYLQAKKVLAKYVGIGGQCPDDEQVDFFVKKVLQYLLIYGTYGNERQFCFHACNGQITLPHELEVPLKVKINGEVGSVWNRWFEYHSGVDIHDCCLAFEALIEEPNRYPTVYDVQSCGEYVGVTSVCQEADDAHVIVKGEDPTGRIIYTNHNGEQIVGEYLGICKGRITRSTVKFGKITEVYKTPTKGYTTLLAVSCDGLSKRFLADYEPPTTTPSYRRYKFLQKCPRYASVSVLGRIRLKEYYADEDLIPFDNILTLEVAGQAVNSMYNSDIPTAQARDAYVEKLIEKEGNYMKVNNGQPIEMYVPLSGGAVMNARRAGRQMRRLRWGFR